MLQDKTMMGKWGLKGMDSFEQKNVARKEDATLRANSVEQ